MGNRKADKNNCDPDTYYIEVAKGKGSYILKHTFKVRPDFDPRRVAFACFFAIKLEPTEIKRIRRGNKKLKSFRCYYT